jgi:hypothetical protein
MHETRIAELEGSLATATMKPPSTAPQHQERLLDELDSSSNNPTGLPQDEGGNAIGVIIGQPIYLPNTNSPVSHTPGFNMDSLDIGAPIATLRSMQALSPDHSKSPADSHIFSIKNRGTANSLYDPVSQGVLSVQDSQRAINMYVHPVINTITPLTKH